MPFHLTENGKSLEIFYGINAVAVALICCLAGIFLIGFIFIFIMRRNRAVALELEQADLTSVFNSKPAEPFTLFQPWQTPRVWLAIRAQDKDYLARAFQMTDIQSLPWHEAWEICSDSELLFSPPVKGWIIVTGEPLSVWTSDIDHCFHLIKRLSRTLGLVHMFKIHPMLGHHLWTQAMNGKILRGYACQDEVIWNQGEMTAAEKKLHLECATYGHSETQHSTILNSRNAEMIYHLASLWSINPVESYTLSTHNRVGIVGRCQVNRWTS